MGSENCVNLRLRHFRTNDTVPWQFPGEPCGVSNEKTCSAIVSSDVQSLISGLTAGRRLPETTTTNVIDTSMALSGEV
ncbi:hypothetical protein IAQ61_009883 [Plenodomus lingam]|uniref:uncharacterized protein n=1 Tax=Leptosphaeria maculans TaxID=5022 RepID=UPI0033291934|nr:hypothetical protein IAQ61_009883 [Plenodomus lingam]